MNLKTTSGAAAVPMTSVLILSLGFALWYRVACICLQISLADLVLLSKAVRENEKNLSKRPGKKKKIDGGGDDDDVLKRQTQEKECSSEELFEQKYKQAGRRTRTR
jgi:hypothetical protein